MRLIDLDGLSENIMNFSLELKVEPYDSPQDIAYKTSQSVLDYVKTVLEQVEIVDVAPPEQLSTTDSDLDSIIKGYTLDCVRLLKSSISETVLHAVEENEKLKEELEKLRKENSELKSRAWRQEIALKLSGKPNKPDKESNCVAYTTMKIQELSEQISSLMKETCEVKFK